MAGKSISIAANSPMPLRGWSFKDKFEDASLKKIPDEYSINCSEEYVGFRIVFSMEDIVKLAKDNSSKSLYKLTWI
jgi:hypothetical protein